MKKDVYVVTIYLFGSSSTICNHTPQTSILQRYSVIPIELWMPLANHCLSQRVRLASGVQAKKKVSSLTHISHGRMETAINLFFSSPRFAVAGASQDQKKFGYKGLLPVPENSEKSQLMTISMSSLGLVPCSRPECATSNTISASNQGDRKSVV